MISITYFSTAVEPFTEAELEALLADIRSRNESLGLTGMMLYVGGHFLQTLEGEADVVRDTFVKISADSRHRDVFVTLEEEIAERAFPAWSMGFERTCSDRASDLPGFNDYLNGQPVPAMGRAGVFHQKFRDKMR